jgi:2-C-methyl-D-erythritol 4-phosphate cytidylyltransferase / 2-C-methyl-D-erythritol 2,4-cyclodiphosphate synthase
MDQTFRTYALLAAGGKGRRLIADLPHSDSPRPKAFRPLGGCPLFLHSLRVLLRCPQLTGVLLIVPEGFEPEAERLVAEAGLAEKVAVITGGENRQQSVFRGLSALPAETDYVLIHDAARPFLTPELVEQCLAGARTHRAAICALPATDTIKSSREGRWVEATLERCRLWTVQTPQAFHYPLILAAHQRAAAAGEGAPDDAFLVEQLGERVYLVESQPENIKLTHKADFTLAESRLRSSGGAPSPSLRIGLGFDAHRFGEGRRLILAGLEFPGPGLLGHSDADLICHAVIDALLGASGQGDIGQHFPDTDPAYEGASSITLLEKAAALVAAERLAVAWLDIVVAAEQPKISPQARAMAENLAKALNIPPDRINLKGKTTEGMGFVGRKEGMACWAMCLLSAVS